MLRFGGMAADPRAVGARLRGHGGAREIRKQLCNAGRVLGSEASRTGWLKITKTQT